ncbi:BTB/POZ domain-containing protein 6-A, partial [Aphelenchoides avenae]
MWKVVEQNAAITVCSDYLVELDKELLLQVVKRDITVDETLLYGRVIAWAKSECARASLEVNSANVREVLGEVLYAIRFPVMTMDEFCKGPAQEEYLTAE